MAKGWKLSPEKRVKHLFSNFSMNHGCWEWKGFITPLGYGRYKWCGKNWLAHRLIYKLFYEEFDETLKVCHRCDNTRCVNPFHLFLGTQAENVADCVSKGRNGTGFKLGIEHHLSKLTPGSVREIRELLKTNISISEISRRFNVDRTAIYCIKNGKTWRSVT